MSIEWLKPSESYENKSSERPMKFESGEDTKLKQEFSLKIES